VVIRRLAWAAKYTPHPGRLRQCTPSWWPGLRKIGRFTDKLAGYPRSTRLARRQGRSENSRARSDAGADRCITKFFFKETFLHRDRAGGGGVNVPVVQGIMPVVELQAVQDCRSVRLQSPAVLANLFDGLDDDLETRRMIAATVRG